MTVDFEARAAGRHPPPRRHPLWVVVEGSSSTTQREKQATKTMKVRTATLTAMMMMMMYCISFSLYDVPDSFDLVSASPAQYPYFELTSHASVERRRSLPSSSSWSITDPPFSLSISISDRRSPIHQQGHASFGSHAHQGSWPGRIFWHCLSGRIGIGRTGKGTGGMRSRGGFDS